MIAFADILAKKSSDPEDNWIKLIFFGIFALIWIISGVASALAKKKPKLPDVPQPWEPSPAPRSLPQPPARPKPAQPQQRARQENRPKLKTQVRKQARGPAMPPPLLPERRAVVPPGQEMVTAAADAGFLRGTTGPAASSRIRTLVGHDLRRAVLMAEVLGTPVSLRDGSVGPGILSAGPDEQEFLPMPPQKAGRK